jgi:hypothetical protein
MTSLRLASCNFSHYSPSQQWLFDISWKSFSDTHSTTWCCRSCLMLFVFHHILWSAAIFYVEGCNNFGWHPGKTPNINNQGSRPSMSVFYVGGVAWIFYSTNIFTDKPIHRLTCLSRRTSILGAKHRISIIIREVPLRRIESHVQRRLASSFST